jgi:hypothetical protein
VSIEEPTDGERPAVLTAAAEVFSSWEAQLAKSMREHGANAAAGERLATLVVAAAEGTVAMCRAQRSTQPLDRVSAQLEELISTAVHN